MAELPKSIRESIEGTKAEYKQLGKSGLRVSVPILGAMSLGDPGWQPWVIDEEKSLPVLKAAYDMGINTWDTANSYSNGTSEVLLGKAIRKYSIPRHKVVILTKCYNGVGETPDVRSGTIAQQHMRSKDYVNCFGLSRQAIIQNVDASLARMQTPYIDLLQIHRFDPSVPIEETMETLHDLVKSGKVRYIGASSMWTYQFAMMQSTAEKNGWTKFVSMQNHYNLLYREEEREMNRYCNHTGVGLIPWGSMARGFVCRPVAGHMDTERAKVEYGLGMAVTSAIRYPPAITEADVKIIGRVEELAKKKGWKMSQVAMAWTKPRVSSPIIGFSSVERMEELIGVIGDRLTEEEERYLEEEYVDRSISGHV